MSVAELTPTLKQRPRERVPALSLLVHDLLAAGARPELNRLVPVIRSIDTQFVNNYRVYKGPDGVVIPVTHVSGTQLLTDVFDETPSPSNNKTLETYFPGFGKNVEEGVKQAVPGILEYIDDRGRTLPPKDFYFFGYPGNMGGKITDQFIHNLTKNGWPYYGKTYAGVIADIIGEDTTVQKITHHGHSKGTYVASYTTIALKDVCPDIQQTPPQLLNPPGSPFPNGYHRKGHGGIKLAAGWGTEKLAKMLAEVIDGGESMSSLDRRFLTDLIPILGDRGIERIEGNPTKRLNFADMRLLVERPKLPDTGIPIIAVVDQGILDLTNLSARDIIHYLQGKREEVIPRGEGAVQRRLHLGIHAPRSFSHRVIDQAKATAEGMSDEPLVHEHRAITRGRRRDARYRERQAANRRFGW